MMKLTLNYYLHKTHDETKCLIHSLQGLIEQKCLIQYWRDHVYRHISITFAFEKYK